VVPNEQPQLASLGSSNSSPEAAGIFRIFQANADPMTTEPAEPPMATGENADPVPLPRRRPAQDAAVSGLETLTLAASSH